MSSDEINWRSASRRLLDWYDRNPRSLPWRGRGDAYEIWVSEVMLQQTRSDTVEGYYEHFLERFPTLEDLGRAADDEVLASWSGLGYYRRARQLHDAARQLVALGKAVPDNVEELLQLPGIGPYTAAAIASLAFGQPEPVVDGNVERVLTRLGAIEQPARRAAGKRRVVELATLLLDRDRPGDSNQAVMDLGARVCKPRNPDCDACPLAFDCAARQQGSQESFPVLAARPRAVREDRVAVVVRLDGRLLMVRRPDSSRLLAGIWELPWVVMSPDATVTPGAIHTAAPLLAARYGGSWVLGPSSGIVRHSVTRRSLAVAVHQAEWRPEEVADGGPLSWVAEDELSNRPTTSLVEKCLLRVDATTPSRGRR